jgi:hypothetical protein
VKTGVQAVLKALKILDSGFRRNDRKRAEPDSFTASGGAGEISEDIFQFRFS